MRRDQGCFSAALSVAYQGDIGNLFTRSLVWAHSTVQDWMGDSFWGVYFVTPSPDLKKQNPQ